MSDHEQKKKLVGPWRSLHGAIWLIGLGILASTGNWWPGILFLIAASMILEAVLLRVAPQAFEEDRPIAATPSSPMPITTELPPSPIPPPIPEHRFELLPNVCPRCGAPTRGQEVRWTGPQSADCPYCGANLPMQKA